jgi:hypothetical protein
MRMYSAKPIDTPSAAARSTTMMLATEPVPVESQIGDDEHHGEQQDDGREVDGLQRLVRSDDSKRHHEDGADDGGPRTVDLHPRKLSECEDEIAASENGVGGQGACVREQHGIDLRHGV